MRLFNLAKASMRNQSGISCLFVPKRTINGGPSFSETTFKEDLYSFGHKHSGKIAATGTIVAVTALAAALVKVEVEREQEKVNLTITVGKKC